MFSIYLYFLTEHGASIPGWSEDHLGGPIHRTDGHYIQTHYQLHHLQHTERVPWGGRILMSAVWQGQCYMQNNHMEILDFYMFSISWITIFMKYLHKNRVVPASLEVLHCKLKGDSMCLWIHIVHCRLVSNETEESTK